MQISKTLGLSALTLAIVSTSLSADQVIGNGNQVIIDGASIQDMNCQNITISSGGTLDTSSGGILQDVTTLTIEGTLNGGTGSILKLSSWINNGTVSSIPQTLQFSTDCGPITVAGTSDTDGDGISDDLEGGTEVDGVAGIGIDDLDVDGDGIYNFLDLDSDGDGIDDATEGTADDDFNGIPNYLQSSLTTCTVINTDDAGAGSFRDALTCSNADPSLNIIDFNIPTSDANYDAGTGVWTIAVASSLPIITQPVVIDGTTAAGASCGDLDAGTPHNLKIALTTSAVVNTGPSLRAGSDGTTFRGLSVYGFQVADLHVYQSSDQTIQCNYIGVEPDGVTTAATPAFHGLSINGLSAVAQNIQVGGAAIGQGNVLSGHSQDGVFLNGQTNNVTVQGNIIGLSADGSTAVPNRSGFNIQFTGSSFGSGIQVGGLAVGEGNIISGNNQRGVLFNRTGSSSNVQGNLVGTSLDGNTAMGNGDSGIEIIAESATSNLNTFTIENNVTAGNGGNGVYLNSDNVSALSDVTITSNIIGRNSTDTADLSNTSQGIRISDASDVIVGGITSDKANVIYAGGPSSNGILVTGDSQAALLRNRISLSTALGIELGSSGDGVTANDGGDGDTGANSFLNYPVFNSLDADGTTSIAYDFNLDVPNNVDGYRIEFFRDNVSGDTHGEAAEYLGSLDINHTGGDLNFTGTFTSDITVANTDNLTATATSKSATGFIETSEFSETRLAITIVIDTDGDGIPDDTDTDDDNDGIPDITEGVLDTDADGIPDSLESNIIDTDGDGNTDYNDNNADNDAEGNDGTTGEQDGVETGSWNDNDGDGIPAHLDPNDSSAGAGDSDNDGIDDDIECPSGYICPDSDGDSIPDYMDDDSDNDGLTDLVEGVLDTDTDGIPDRLESNIIDTDGDGNTDHNDNNADNDAEGNDGTGGEQDTVETGIWNDNDGDGIPAHLDPNDSTAGSGDSDNDGIDDDIECPSGYICPDSDGDSIPDYMDDDSDNDGLTDLAEGILDTDTDGIPDRLESNTTDTDGDDNTDHDDNNADGDTEGNDGTAGEQDGVETGIWNDNDGDGIPAHLDPNDSIAGVGDADNDGINDDIECSGVFPCPDTDGDGTPDYMDAQADTSDLELVMTSDKSTALAGEELVYTLTLLNKGTLAASTITIRDNLPTGLSYLSDIASQGTYDFATGVWDVGTLNGQTQATLDITVIVD